MGVAHTEALRRLGIPIKGIVGSTPERAWAKAAEANLPDVYDSLEALLADAEIDAVHITSPNQLHYDQVVAVIEAGKHVVCEKPLAVSVDQGSDLLNRAHAANLIHAVCFNQRYYPMVHQAHTMVSHRVSRPVPIGQRWLPARLVAVRYQLELGGSWPRGAEPGGWWPTSGLTGLTTSSLLRVRESWK